MPATPTTEAPDAYAEDWQIDFAWLRVRHFVKDSLRHPRLPDLRAVLMMIGVQELGRWRKDFTKEEKQDLMHVGTCECLTAGGYYRFTHRDADGWPHYRAERDVEVRGEQAQERFLKREIIRYFETWERFDAQADVPATDDDDDE